MPAICGGQKGTSDPRILEKRVCELPDVGAGNQAWILWKILSLLRQELPLNLG